MYGFVFDFDGPLFPGRKIAIAALKDTLAAFQHEPGMPVASIEHLPLLRPKQMLAVVCAGRSVSAERAAEMESHYRRELEIRESETDADAHTKRAIYALKERGFRLAILSRRPSAAVEVHLVRMGLRECFEIVLGRDAVTSPKPSPEGIYRIAKEFAIPASSLVVIGDSDCDYEAAAAAGSVYYHSGWTGEPSIHARTNAAATIPRPDDLHELADAATTVLRTAPPILPDELLEAVKKDAFAFYAGAGVSIPSGFGGWEQHYIPLFTNLRAGMLANEMESEDALQLLCSDGSKANAVFDAFKHSFVEARWSPNGYHYAMLRSAAQHIWTSNYDGLFERANEEARLSRRIVTDDTSLLNEFRERDLVVKMNGDFAGATWGVDLDWSVVLLREQFDRSELRRPEVWRTFEDDYRNKAMIMVGLSFNDSALRRITSVQRRRIPRPRRTHYLLTKRPDGPLAERKSVLHAKNLARLGIKTLFFDSHADVLTFVRRTTLVSLRPMIAFSGSVRHDQSGGYQYDGTQRLTDGSIALHTIEQICGSLGKEIAGRKGFRVGSGGAPGVGLPAVRAAFESDPVLARFYLRQKGTLVLDRSAPSIIVPGGSLTEMRKRLIGDSCLVVGIGGGGSGLFEELDMALDVGVPVLLIPQSGGAVAEFEPSLPR